MNNKAVYLIGIAIKINDNVVNYQYGETISLYDLSSLRTSDTVYLNIGDTIKILTHQESGVDAILLGFGTPSITSLSINKL